jgi:hypothetical protein
VFLLGAAAVVLVRVLPDLLGAEGEPMAGDTGWYAMLVVVPQAVGGLIALLGARLLWRGNSGGVPLALLWVSLAGLASAITFVATGNIRSAVRMILVESAGWLIFWPELHIYPDANSIYYSQLTDVTFWTPGIVAVGALKVACFLLGALVFNRRRRGWPA